MPEYYIASYQHPISEYPYLKALSEHSELYMLLVALILSYLHILELANLTWLTATVDLR